MCVVLSMLRVAGIVVAVQGLLLLVPLVLPDGSLGSAAGSEWWLLALADGLALAGLSGPFVHLWVIRPYQLESTRTSTVLRESERRLNEAQRIARIGSWELDLGTSALTWSDEIYRIFEIDRAGFGACYQAFLDAVHPEDREMVDRAYRRSLEDRKPYEVTHRLRMSDGRVKWVHERGETDFDADGTPLVSRGTVQDVTERKLARQALEDSEARLQNAVESISEGFALFDPEGRLVLCNSQYKNLYGYSDAEAAPGTHTRDLGEIDLARGTVVLDPREREAYLRRRDNPREVPGVYLIQLADGTYLETRDFVTSDGGIVSIQTDVTAQRLAEERLRQAQKMEAVGQLTGGVAHDFNNLLAVIQGNAELLSSGSGDQAAPRGAILRASKRGSELTQRLLAFSRRQPLHPRALDIGALIGSLAELMARTLGETVKIETVVVPGSWGALADAGQLENALLNLAINARDAMPQGGTLTVACSNETLDAAAAERNPDAVPGDYVVLSVTDTGTGMSPEACAHAFEPFFTTKGPGKGSGLGLSMVYGFARQSGGHVAIESRLGRGTTVKLYLPRATEPCAAAVVEPANDEMPRGRGERVLVVEDDPDMRGLAVSMVRRLGYHSVEAGDVCEARSVLARDPAVALVLSDVILPGGTSGPAFAEELERSHPDLAVVLMSGYPADEMSCRDLIGPDRALLYKPFRMAELARALGDALSDAARRDRSCRGPAAERRA